MKPLCLLSAVLLLTIPPSSRAADPGPPTATPAVLPQTLDLQTAIDLALEHNPGLRQTIEQLSLQDGVLSELRASRRPRLKATGDYTVYDDNRLQSFGSPTPPENTRWQADAEASITVFSGGFNRLSIRSGTATRRAVTAELEAARQTLLADVHEAYYNALLDQETITVRKEAIRVLDEQLKYARNRFDAGAGAKFDVLQAEVAAANARPPLVRAGNSYRRDIDNLRRLLGVVFAPGTDGEDIRLRKVPAPEPPELQLETALQTALAQRRELTDIAFQIDAARDKVAANHRLNYPVVDLFAGFGTESDQFGGGDLLQGWITGARLTWSMFDGGKARGRVAQEAAAYRQLLHRRDELKLSIASEVRQAFYDYQEARSILETTGLVIAQAEEALRLARNRYRAGKGTQIDVLQSQLQLTRARLEDSTALNSLQRALVRIRRAMGEPL